MPPVRLQPGDRETNRKLVDQPPRLEARVKAAILLDAERGHTDEQIAQRLAISVFQVGQVVTAYLAGGLVAVGLTRTRLSGQKARRRSRLPGLVKTPGVCGSARIKDTRIPVWQLVEERKLGASAAQLLNDYRTLKARDLAAAWEYAEEHPEEIDEDIRRNAMG
ncbi:hypothetical protein OJF2_78950 (plasmid) [Aquisphaera giovannonii]|uniref:DUF433 domain-containing protein n=1 Tax=Aquisphaera giovannonii TaxID=406548 RepID=A0A5B9WHN7_9BACT|nr:DUF433 domain-containing protein [Aquisphaera giovannonii]QEH39280.1 hypothetical protein OJF2_78950 [Aquisphaera giovannonii]